MSVISIVPKLEKIELPKLKNKNVLIIGGTHGIGLATAKLCRKEGAFVAVIGRTQAKTKDTRIYQGIFDVMDTPKKVLESYFTQYPGGVDYCLMNIGLYYKGEISKTSLKKFREILEVNLVKTFEVMKMAGKYMNNNGVFITMSSRPTLEKYHSWSAYTLAKQGVITLTQALAEEQPRFKSYAVCPSRVDTKFREAIFPNEDKNTRLSPQEVARLIVTLFNGQNTTGNYYWIKKKY